MNPPPPARPYHVDYSSGRWSVRYEFASESVYVVWGAFVEAMKEFIASINADGNPTARLPKYRHWLGQCHAFIEDWGEDMLPPDIKWAMNEVERDIGAPVTQWTNPPN